MMGRSARLVLLLAIGTSIAAIAGFWCTIDFSYRGWCLGLNRSGIGFARYTLDNNVALMVNEETENPVLAFDAASETTFFYYPPIEFTQDDIFDLHVTGMGVTHWFANLIVWSLFLILLRRSRKHPKGHCQDCGYDLTGNESGACPECNAVAEVTA